MSMKESTVLGEAPGLTVQSESQTIEHNTKHVPVGPRKKRLMLKWESGYGFGSSSILFFHSTSLQFTVLDEDIFCQLDSFLEDFLNVDVGHS